jgi:hypothetical protein
MQEANRKHTEEDEQRNEADMEQGVPEDESDKVDTIRVYSYVGKAFNVQETSLDLNKLASGGNNIIIMSNNMSQSIDMNQEQFSQIRQAPSGDYVVGSTAPRDTTRLHMLPPHEKPGVDAVTTAEALPESGCACSLSRTRCGVGVRPISAITRKAAKAEHQSIGELFGDIERPQKLSKDAVKVTKRKLKLDDPALLKKGWRQRRNSNAKDSNTRGACRRRPRDCRTTATTDPEEAVNSWQNAPKSREVHCFPVSGDFRTTSIQACLFGTAQILSIAAQHIHSKYSACRFIAAS